MIVAWIIISIIIKISKSISCIAINIITSIVIDRLWNKGIAIIVATMWASFSIISVLSSKIINKLIICIFCVVVIVDREGINGISNRSIAGCKACWLDVQIMILHSSWEYGKAKI